MKLALCNEVIRELPFDRQCALAAELGYAGLELAPFTLGEETHRMSATERVHLRRVAADAGVAICGLHWLLVAPKGLSITTPDRALWQRTVDVMAALVDLCAELGGDYLVHGSPAQRLLRGNGDGAARRAEQAWTEMAPRAAKAGVVYCIEPLAPRETDLVNRIEEAAAIVRRIGSPAVRTMLDTSAAAAGETQSPAELVRHWLPTGLLAHVQLNDRNRRGPGQGRDAFTPVLRALKDGGYAGWLAMEPFDYKPDGPTCAARSIGYVQGVLEGLS